MDLLFLKDPLLLSLLEKIPHQILNQKGKIYGQSLRVPIELMKSFTLELNNSEVIVFAQTQDHQFLKNLLLWEKDIYNKNYNLKKNKLMENNLNNDCFWPLLIKHSEQSFKQVIKHFFTILKSYILANSGSLYLKSENQQYYLFATFDNKSETIIEQKELFSLDPQSFEGITAIGQVPLTSSFPLPYPSVFITEGDRYRDFQKYTCIPLCYAGKSHGLLVLKSILDNPYSNFEIRSLELLSTSFGHFLQHNHLQSVIETEEKHLENLKQYIPHQLISNIQNHGQKNRHHSVRKKIVSMHVDIRSFTTISEKIGPQKLIELLNFYFSEIIHPIQQYDGMLMKIIGDAIWAVWNGDHDIHNAEIQAMKTAMHMQRKMISVVAPFWQTQGIDRVGIGIGISSGECLLGNVGSSKYLDFSVIGPAVHQSSYLESLARPAEIITTENVFNKISATFPPHDKIIRNVSLQGSKNTHSLYLYRPYSYPDY